MSDLPSQRRHRWGAETRTDQGTRWTCATCGVVKVRWPDPYRITINYEHANGLIVGRRPNCEAA